MQNAVKHFLNWKHAPWGIKAMHKTALGPWTEVRHSEREEVPKVAYVSARKCRVGTKVFINYPVATAVHRIPIRSLMQRSHLTEPHPGKRRIPGAGYVKFRFRYQFSPVADERARTCSCPESSCT